MKVTTRDKAGNTAENTITGYTYIYLVDKVALGDYVAYDAGTWETTVDSPSSSTGNATFGGYTEGQDKGTSVSGSTSGWVVLSKTGSGSTGKVTLISAGSPAYAYYSASSSNQSSFISSLNNFANNNFVNSDYASSARNAVYSDLSSLSASSILRTTGEKYWLADAVNTSIYTGSGFVGNYFWWNYASSLGWYYTGGYYSYYSSTSTTYRYGVRKVDASGNFLSDSSNSRISHTHNTNQTYLSTSRTSRTSNLTTGVTYYHLSGSETIRLGTECLGIRVVVDLLPGVLSTVDGEII